MSSVLREAESLVHGDRGADYGHPLDDFARTAAMVNALIAHKLKPGERITEEDWGLFMVCCKLSRQINRPKRDNLVDGAGYLETVRMVLEEKERRTPAPSHQPNKPCC